MMEKMTDTGKRLKYGEGMREDDAGKGMPDLITPFGLDRLSKWTERGAIKYKPRNWEKSTIPFSRYTRSMFRHLIQWMICNNDEDHLAAIAWNAFAIIHFQELGRSDLDDMPHYFDIIKKINKSKK